MLCYVDGYCIRILDLHQASKNEDVIDLEVIGQHHGNIPKPFSRAELLHYQGGVLSFLYYTSDVDPESYGSEEAWLIAIEIRSSIPIPQKIRLAVPMPHSKFWVKNDSQYLYVGSHDGIGDHRHHEWRLQGYNLSSGQKFRPLQLCNLFGSDLRQTIIFEVYDGYLYALSNQSSFEVEEIDWTSYYHCYRFPVNNPVEDQLERLDFWRRQHREGPINDSWTDLSLHQDERSGLLEVTECRREWKDGSSAQSRTYYNEPISFPSNSQDSEGLSPLLMNEPRAVTTSDRYPVDDPLYKLIGEDDRPLYSQPIVRISRNFHPEYSNPESPAQTFLLAKTKHRTYVPSSKAYFDLVQDNYNQPAPRHWQQQLRLRIGSRSQSSPLNPETGLLHERVLDEDEVPVQGSEDCFRDRGIQLWPPADAPVELLDLLNPDIAPGSPSRVIGDVTAVSDERSVIYMPGSLFRSDRARNIVLVNFDPGLRFPGLAPMKVTRSAGDKCSKVILERKGNGNEKRVDERPISQDPRPNDVDVSRDVPASWSNWWRREGARYLNIARGFQFV